MIADMTPDDQPELPPGASVGSEWGQHPEFGRVYRYLDWPSRWSEDKTTVAGVTGPQFGDGNVHRRIALNFDDVNGNEVAADITDMMALNIISVLCPALSDWGKSL